MKGLREKEIEDGAVIASGGNVFADLGLPDAEELLAKSAIAMKINQIIDKRHLSQTEAAALLGITQPKVSMIQHGKLRGFSLEKLCNLLTLLGRDVDIVIRERKKGGGMCGWLMHDRGRCHSWALNASRPEGQFLNLSSPVAGNEETRVDLRPRGTAGRPLWRLRLV